MWKSSQWLGKFFVVWSTSWCDSLHAKNFIMQERVNEGAHIPADIKTMIQSEELGEMNEYMIS